MDVSVQKTISPMRGMVNSFGLPRLMAPRRLGLVARARHSGASHAVHGLPQHSGSSVCTGETSIVGKFAAMGHLSVVNLTHFCEILRHQEQSAARSCGWT